jgi:hypothetical protein
MRDAVNLSEAKRALIVDTFVGPSQRLGPVYLRSPAVLPVGLYPCPITNNNFGCTPNWHPASLCITSP